MRHFTVAGALYTVIRSQSLLGDSAIRRAPGETAGTRLVQ